MPVLMLPRQYDAAAAPRRTTVTIDDSEAALLERLLRRMEEGDDAAAAGGDQTRANDRRCFSVKAGCRFVRGFGAMASLILVSFSLMGDSSYSLALRIIISLSPAAFAFFLTQENPFFAREPFVRFFLQ
ncbi:hypothetical protein OsJ_04413 [Oryza sativa Japonica Group]|uniref:Uncharacterized protein n=2 Tax=Oryza TaxID=4527 RepID=A3A0J4_ORYSJ|nr:hypothetical protein OsJ_04413 [Oryza sativa Japonica Group]